MKTLYAIFFVATLLSCRQPERKPEINPLFSAQAADPVTVIAPSAIAQSPEFRFTTDVEKAKWNEAYAASRIVNIPAANITQDATRRFVTDAEKAVWNKSSPQTNNISVSADAITQTSTGRLVTDAQIKLWSTVTRLKGVGNINLKLINDSTIEISMLPLAQMNTFDRDRLVNPTVGTMIFNTDTKKLNFRSTTKWLTIWSDSE